MQIRSDLETARLARRHSITGFLVKKSDIFCTLTIPTLIISKGELLFVDLSFLARGSAEQGLL